MLLMKHWQILIAFQSCLLAFFSYEQNNKSKLITKSRVGVSRKVSARVGRETSKKRKRKKQFPVFLFGETVFAMNFIFFHFPAYFSIYPFSCMHDVHKTLTYMREYVRLSLIITGISLMLFCRIQLLFFIVRLRASHKKMKRFVWIIGLERRISCWREREGKEGYQSLFTKDQIHQ